MLRLLEWCVCVAIETLAPVVKHSKMPHLQGLSTIAYELLPCFKEDSLLQGCS